MENRTSDNRNKSQLLEILKFNKGFNNPQRWLEYARQHSFKKRKAYYLPKCPECDLEEGHIIGQYVHFSQLVRLRKCNICGLVYSDVLLDPNFVKEYFEDAYKDEKYFVKQRKLIFKHIIDVISELIDTSKPFRVIDIGGAKGHLSHLISSYFSMAEVTLNDISEEACQYAAKTFSLKTVCCNINGLSKLKKKYDIVLLIDVFYYVRDIRAAWETIKELLEDDGVMLLRVPNRLQWVIFFQKIRKLVTSQKRLEMQDKVIGINPEHIRFFSIGYLKKRVRESGLHSFAVYPSPPLLPLRPFKRALAKAFWVLAASLYSRSNEKVIITPSIIISAKK